MSDVPLVSVIIPNYNYASYVGQAISSVINQSYSKIEIIVVNNGSTDNSLMILEAYSDQIIVVNQTNQGQAGARNTGLKVANGDLIAFLDADDYWADDKLEKQIELITPETELVYCGISAFQNANPTNKSVLTPKYRGDCHSFFLREPGVSIVISGESTALITRNLLNKVGLFDTSLDTSAGWDFFRRCSKLTKFDFVPEALTNYRLHETNMSKSIEKNVSGIRKAYILLFADHLWKVSNRKKFYLIAKLEFRFFKTFLRKKYYIDALKCIIRIVLKNGY